MAENNVISLLRRALQNGPSKTIKLNVLAPMAVYNNSLLYCPKAESVFSSFDSGENKVTDIPRKFEVIDMCFSSYSNGFLILSQRPSALYLLDLSATTPHPQQIKEFDKSNMWSCSCDRETLIVSQGNSGSTIEMYNLRDVSNPVQTFNAPVSCQSNQQIEKIRFNSDGSYVGLILCQRAKDDPYNGNYPHWFELRRPNDMTVVSVVQPQTILGDDGWCWLLSLPNQQFLATLWRKKKFFLIGADGTVQETTEYDNEVKFLNSIALLNDKCLVVQSWKPDEIRFYDL
jgi:hypothetical protein